MTASTALLAMLIPTPVAIPDMTEPPRDDIRPPLCEVAGAELMLGAGADDCVLAGTGADREGEADRGDEADLRAIETQKISDTINFRINSTFSSPSTSL